MIIACTWPERRTRRPVPGRGASIHRIPQLRPGRISWAQAGQAWRGGWPGSVLRENTPDPLTAAAFAGTLALLAAAALASHQPGHLGARQ